MNIQNFNSVDISNSTKFRIKEEPYEFGIKYTLQIKEKKFFITKWRNYKIRVNSFNDKTFKFIKISFSLVDTLKKFFKLYSEKAIIYKNMKIYTYCFTAYDLGWNIMYMVPNIKDGPNLVADSLPQIKRKIRIYLNGHKKSCTNL